MTDLIRDLAIVLADDSLGTASFMARRRLRRTLGLAAYEDPGVIEATLRAALDGRPQPERREIIWRREVQPGLAVLVEDSTNILLELSATGMHGGQAQVLGRSGPVNRQDIISGLEEAHVAATVARDDADAERARHLRRAEWARVNAAPRDGELATSRAQAEAELSAAGLDAYDVARVLKRAYGHLSATFNVDGTEQLGTASYNRGTGEYHVRVPQQPATAVDYLALISRPNSEAHARHEAWQDDTLARLSKTAEPTRCYGSEVCGECGTGDGEPHEIWCRSASAS